MHARPRFASFLLLLAACVRTTPQPAAQPVPPTPVFVVPPGCLEPLSGTWVHATDPGYRYEAEDDGGTLTLIVSHSRVVDAGFSPRRFRLDAGPALDAGAEELAPDAGPEPLPSARIELQRSAQGFAGATIAPLTHPSGRACEGRFPTTVLSCADGGLLLQTQSATALGDACQAPARPLEQLAQDHLLLRPDAG